MRKKLTPAQKKRKRAYDAAWYQGNKTSVSEYNKGYYRKNRARISERRKKKK